MDQMGWIKKEGGIEGRLIDFTSGKIHIDNFL
jgi:hypothetical protein